LFSEAILALRSSVASLIEEPVKLGVAEMVAVIFTVAISREASRITTINGKVLVALQSPEKSVPTQYWES